jgi:hypothetical protein
MNDLEKKLAELKILQTKFDIWVDRLGSNDDIVKKIQSEIDSANSLILDLMVLEQEDQRKKATIL